jgi:hypothetical protein
MSIVAEVVAEKETEEAKKEAEVAADGMSIAAEVAEELEPKGADGSVEQTNIPDGAAGGPTCRKPPQLDASVMGVPSPRPQESPPTAQMILFAIQTISEKPTDADAEAYVRTLLQSPIMNINSGVIVREWGKLVGVYQSMSDAKKINTINLLNDIITRKVNSCIDDPTCASRCRENLRAEVLELVDFARLKLSNDNNNTLKTKITNMVDGIRDLFNNRSGSMETAVQWYHVKTSLNAGDEQRCLVLETNGLDNGACHQTILIVRRMYRARTEASLGNLVICDVTNHLFTAQAYTIMRPKIEEYMAVMQQDSSAKASLATLLRLHFFARAQREAATIFLSIAADVKEVTKALKMYPPEVIEVNVAKQMTAIERKIQRTYETAITTEADDVIAGVTQSQTPPAEGIVVGGGSGNSSSAPSAPPPKPEAASAPPAPAPAPAPPAQAQATDNYDALNPNAFPEIEQVDDTKRNTSVAQRVVQSYGYQLSQAYSTLKKALAEASSSTVNSGVSMNLYTHNVVLHRLSAITRAIDTMYQDYTRTRSRMVLMDDRMLQSAERERFNKFLIHSRLKTTEIIKYRFMEERTQAFYVLKLWRILSQLVALWAAQHVYMDRYNQRVLGGGTQDSAPPDLGLFLTTFLGIDASIQLVTLLVLVFLARLRPHTTSATATPTPDGRKFLIDDAFIQAFLIEYFVTTLMIATLMLLCDSIVFRNKYFQLRENGARSLQTYRFILTGICIVVNLIPFFIIFY